MSAAFTIRAVVAVLKSGNPWMWVAFALGALVVVSFAAFHRKELETARSRKELPSQIDDLMREGMSLANELSAPVEPERIEPNQISIPIGDAPAEWWDKAQGFDQRIRDLLIEHHPALLSDYAAGANEQREQRRQKDQQREAAIEANPALDRRSDPEKMRDFANATRTGPLRFVEASLEGLVAARHRISG